MGNYYILYEDKNGTVQRYEAKASGDFYATLRYIKEVYGEKAIKSMSGPIEENKVSVISE